ncbi:MAG: hypothetical protein H6666_15875 [Ardenticatenaceae bacterium]|nr:hypothetical protein [Anaerolineales bacterium]MCB8919395.1 hypothetical protein [Ardenticatenaceae bacterium]
MGTFLVDLNSFTVIKKSDLGRDEPYLWLFGIAIELGVGSSSDPTRFIIKRPAGPGNLGGRFKKGEKRTIPNSVGRIEKPVQPIFGRLGLGFITMAWDHDRTPAGAVQAAYGDAALVLNDFIQGRVQTLNTGPLSDAELAAIRHDIEGHIRDRFKATVTLRRPGSLNQDDFVGMDFRFITPDPAGTHQEDLSMNFAARGVSYQVDGLLRYTP